MTPRKMPIRLWKAALWGAGFGVLTHFTSYFGSRTGHPGAFLFPLTGKQAVFFVVSLIPATLLFVGVASIGNRMLRRRAKQQAAPAEPPSWSALVEEVTEPHGSSF
jgi:hypothetical protein